ncbi:PAS domain-containing sensor histidine kinase [Pedobacter sp. BMA]|uniref:PAS domain-containing sensor histidine kinase n=1 Tax=Pedobacter sp. BMA TaxID=1663685 RepID=UPI00064A4AB2|nr:PAS domain-containing sensor histidine kinase [Pedobacter sp. BMA]KLT66082.1 hypothetical protein AB669_07905 [Pedobacter sp. BMA]
MSELNYDLFFQLGSISSMGYFIYHVDERKFSYLNKSFSEILEIEQSDLKSLPQQILHQVHPEDREHAMFCFEECLLDNEEKMYEVRLKISGREKYIRVVVSPLHRRDNIDLVGTVEDTTIMRHNKIHIEQINSRKNITLEVLAHDLKEPLGMMKLAASSIEQGLAKNEDAEMSSGIAFIKNMCERNLLLIRSMINKEFLKSSEVEIGKERTDIVLELRDVIRFFKRSKIGKTRTFVFEASANKIFLQLDSMKFLQVINNLISNSLKFTDDNGIIRLHVQELENSVLLTVADNGIGIPEPLQPGLFTRLPQTLRSGLRGEESGGFGMSIIKAIVDLHQGKIWFESKVGLGTTFYIKLPK